MAAGTRFLIPIKPENLLVESTRATHSNIYTVKSTDFTLSELSGALTNLEKEFSTAIEDPSQFVWDNFDLFFNCSRRYDQIEPPARKRFRDILVRTLVKYVRHLEIIFPAGSADAGSQDLSQSGSFSQESSGGTGSGSRTTAHLTSAEKLSYCNTLKMLVWLITQLVVICEDDKQSKATVIRFGVDLDGGGSSLGGSRSGKGSNKVREEIASWGIDKERIAERLIMLYTHFPIHRLFSPPILEDEFVQLLTKIAYKMLESHETIKSRPHLRENIFSILGTAVAKNKQGLSLCVRIIQLLQTTEKLADILSQLVFNIVDTHHEKSIVRDIIVEIDRIDVKELSRDSSGPRAIGEFMCHLSERLPAQFVPHIHLMYPFLEQDSYPLRNATLTVFGNVITKLRETGGEAPEAHIKNLRDTLLEKLEDHIHDVTGYVRSHTLQVWSRLCSCLDAVPRSRYQSVMEDAIGRLNDKVCQVRKSAVQLLNTILRNSPYGANMSLKHLRQLRKETRDKLDKMIAENEQLHQEAQEKSRSESTENGTVATESNEDGGSQATDDDEDEDTEEELSASGDTQPTGESASGAERSGSAEASEETSPTPLRDLPELHKLQILDKHFQEAVHFSEMITSAMPAVANLLNATNLSDTQEAIKFFVTAHRFRLDGTAPCIRKIISLIWSGEEKVRNEAFAAYKEIYFSNTEGNSEKEHARLVVESLTELITSATIGDMASLEEFVRRLVECGEISKGVKDFTWLVYTMKRPGTTIEDCRAAASLIWMYGTSDWKFLEDNMEVLIKCGLEPVESTGGKYDSRLVRETCTALTRAAPPNLKPDDKYPSYRRAASDPLFERIILILIDRLQDVDDQYFYSMADEALKAVFVLADHPEWVCEQLIRRSIREIVTKAKEDSLSADPSAVNSQAPSIAGSSVFPSSSQSSSAAAPPSICSEDSQRTRTTTLASVLGGGGGGDQLIPPNTSPYIDGEVFTRFIIMLGDMALNMLIHVEYNIMIELKVRNRIKEEKENRKGRMGKTPSKTPSRSRLSRSGGNPNESIALGTEEDEMLGGASAINVEDTQMEALQKICREEIITGNLNLLAKFSPMLIDIARDSLTYSDVRLRTAATLTLCKFMVVSEIFCTQKLPPISMNKKEEGTNLQLLFTILEKCKEPTIKCNTIIGLSDLCGRFSNLLDPWTPRLFSLIQDKDVTVRKTALLALARLVVSDQLKPRKFGSQMARLIVDSDPMVVGHSKQVFKQLKSRDTGKSATIYNMIPDILANLCGHKSSNRLESEGDVKVVMDFLFEMITRDHEKEGLIRTICQRIKETTDEEEIRHLSYCLTLMTYSLRGFKMLIEFTPTLGIHLTDDTVHENVNKIIEATKQNKAINGTQEFKDLVEQFNNDVKKIRDVKVSDPQHQLDESEIQALGIVSGVSPKISKRPPPTRGQSTAKKSRGASKPSSSKQATSTSKGRSTRSRRQAQEESDDDDEEEVEEEVDDDDEEAEEFAARPKLRKPGSQPTRQSGRAARTRKAKFQFSSSEEEEEEEE